MHLFIAHPERAAFLGAITALAVLGLCCAPASAAGTRVEGRVFDAKTQKPLPLANVYIPSEDRVEVTDSNGYFILENIESTAITVTFSYIGYRDETITIDTAKSTVPVAIYLMPAPLYMKEITVTATRTAKDELLAPNMIYSVKQREWRDEKTVRTTPEALRDIPGIMVQKTANGQGSPYMRGFTGFRTLFLIDGVRLNNSTFRDGPNQYWNTVDHLSLERLEIVMGPGSVLYGSDAIGGTVNAISHGRRQGDTIAAHGTALYRYASAEHSNLARVELGGEYAHRLGYLLGLSGKDFGDLEGGADVGTQPRTGYDEWNGDIKLDLLMQNDSKLTLMHQTTVQNDVWRTHATIYGITWEGLSTGSDKKQAYDQTRHLTYLQYHGIEPMTFLDQLTANVSYQTQDEERSRVRSSDKSEIQGFTVGTIGAWLQGGSQTSFGYWTFGADWYHDDVESFQRSYKPDGSLDKVEIQGPVADDAAYDLLGVFCQDDVPLSRAVDLLAGARYSYARTDASKVRDPLDGEVISVSGDWSSFVGNVRLLFHAGGSEKHAFFGGVSQGFRAPNLSDLTRFDTARSGEIETASPGLTPERFMTYEAGFKARLDWLAGQVSYFYTSIDDMIIRVPTGAMIDESYEVTKMNSGEGYVQGVACGAVATFLDMFRVTGSLSWLDGSVDAYPTSTSTMVEEPVSRLMPPTGELAVRWGSGRKRYWIEGAVYAADRQDKLSTSDRLDTQRIPPEGTPGFAVFHLHAGWKIHEHLDISAAIENIGDEDYRIHGSGVNEPGRNLVFSMHTSF